MTGDEACWEMKRRRKSRLVVDVQSGFPAWRDGWRAVGIRLVDTQICSRRMRSACERTSASELLELMHSEVPSTANARSNDTPIQRQIALMRCQILRTRSGAKTAAREWTT
jgi:hypothetical protein